MVSVVVHFSTKLFRTYLTHLMLKTNRPFYEFIGGGAGVGKSRLISAIYQALNHRYNS